MQKGLKEAGALKVDLMLVEQKGTSSLVALVLSKNKFLF